jgi:siroheme synthase-like protein
MPKMKYLPIGLDVRGRDCVVVGGGQVGARKAVNLVRAGAAVTVVSPEVTEELAEMAKQGRLRWVRETYQRRHLDGAFLAVAATENDEVNARLVLEAREGRVLVCDASDAGRSEVIFGALHQTDNLTLAVFTDGRDPALARRTRDRIAKLSDGWEER